MEVTEGGMGTALIETVKAMKPGTDLVVMMYFDRDGGRTELLAFPDQTREQLFESIMQQVRRGVIMRSSGCFSKFRRLV